MAETIYLTQERQNELRQELENLKSIGRQEVARKLKQAKELGDLSENAEYQEAREEQRRLEYRINQLEDLLRRAVIIRKIDRSQTVRLGSVVSVSCDGNRKTFTIVGSNEAEPAEGRISNVSPIGRGLLGKKIGDSVKVKTPRGEIEYQILNIE